MKKDLRCIALFSFLVSVGMILLGRQVTVPDYQIYLLAEIPEEPIPTSSVKDQASRDVAQAWLEEKLGQPFPEEVKFYGSDEQHFAMNASPEFHGVVRDWLTQTYGAEGWRPRTQPVLGLSLRLGHGLYGVRGWERWEFAPNPSGKPRPVRSHYTYLDFGTESKGPQKTRWASGGIVLTTKYLRYPYRAWPLLLCLIAIPSGLYLLRRPFLRALPSARKRKAGQS